MTTITEQLQADLPRLLAEREQRGIETYGHTLAPWNGRDAARDALEELLDALQYVTQLRREHDELVAAVRSFMQTGNDVFWDRLVWMIERYDTARPVGA